MNYQLNPAQASAINFIRGLSAQGVLIGHLLFWDGFLDDKMYARYYGLASYCVVVFFVLSGFLICNSALQKKNYLFKHFVLDRFTRIYTALVPALVLVFAIDFFLIYKSNGFFLWGLYLKEFIGNILMLQEFPVLQTLQNLTNNDIFYMPYFGSDLPLWTLSIEWWLYMLFGWVMLGNYSNKLKFWLVAFTFAIVPVYQLFIGTHMGKGLVIYWVIGCLIPFALDQLKEKKFHGGWISLLLVVLSFFGFIYGFEIGAFIFWFGLVSSLKYLENNDIIFHKFFDKFIENVAGYSFSLYLLHYPLIFLFMQIIPSITGWPFMLKFFVLILLVNLTTYFFATQTEFKYKQVRQYIKKLKNG